MFYRNDVQSTPGTSAQHHPRPTKSTSRRSSTGTGKDMLLKQLQRNLQRKFDGRIPDLNVDDLVDYSVESGKGSCRIKCPICDKLIKVNYGGSSHSHWILSHVARHIDRHFQ